MNDEWTARDSLRLLEGFRDKHAAAVARFQYVASPSKRRVYEAEKRLVATYTRAVEKLREHCERVGV